MLNVAVKINQSHAQRIAKKLEPSRLKAWMEIQVSPDLVAAVRKNVVQDGKPSGKFAKLSPGYAAQKDNDNRAGKIQYNGKERWRRTGNLVESLEAPVEATPTGMRVFLTASGTDVDGVSNAEKLVWLCKGTGTMPPRDPTADLSLFEKRVETKLRKLVASL